MSGRVIIHGVLVDLACNQNKVVFLYLYLISQFNSRSITIFLLLSFVAFSRHIFCLMPCQTNKKKRNKRLVGYVRFADIKATLFLFHLSVSRFLFCFFFYRYLLAEAGDTLFASFIGTKQYK